MFEILDIHQMNSTPLMPTKIVQGKFSLGKLQLAIQNKHHSPYVWRLTKSLIVLNTLRTGVRYIRTSIST